MTTIFILLLVLLGADTPRPAQGRDTNPPTVIWTYPGGPVLLAWDPNTETELAGYNVYRSEVSGVYGERINDSLIPLPMYRDDSAELNKTYYYVTRAVLKDGTEGPASNEIVIKR